MVTSVQRPCLMMSVQGVTETDLAVKGAAMEASPAWGRRAKEQIHARSMRIDRQATNPNADTTHARAGTLKIVHATWATQCGSDSTPAHTHPA